MTKVLHTADLHLRDKNIEEAERCCDFLVDTAITKDVDLSIIAADIFDSRDIKVESQAARLAIRTVSRLADQSPVAIITGTPSHDGLAPEILRYAKGEHEIFVATSPLQIPCCTLAEASGFKYLLTLIPQPTKQFFQTNSDIQTGNVEISEAMNALFMGFGARAADYDCPHILIGHWNVSGSRLPTGQTLTGQDIDISVDQMMLANPDLICLGHIHLHQQLGDRAFYPGSLYPLTWGELENKGFYIHTLEGRNLIESRFIETPIRKLIRFGVDLTKDNNVKFPDFLKNVKDCYVRFDITLWQDDVTNGSKEQMRQDFIDAGALDADVRFIRLPRQTVRSESVLKVESLRDKLVAMAAIKEETVPESILTKADDLELGPSEDVIRRVA